jgi:hypothetical protein
MSATTSHSPQDNTMISFTPADLAALEEFTRITDEQIQEMDAVTSYLSKMDEILAQREAEEAAAPEPQPEEDGYDYDDSELPEWDDNDPSTWYWYETIGLDEYDMYQEDRALDSYERGMGW